MARPKKYRLDYFPFDVDFFDDEKIVCIGGEFGIKGEITAIKLLCAVYRNGYFVEWNDAVKAKILRQLPTISAELLDQIVNRLVRWGFFDVSLFDSDKILTSEGIQRRYFEAMKRCGLSDNLPYNLVNVAKTRVNVAKTRVNVTEIPQNKIKEKKEKSSTDVEDEKKREKSPATPQTVFENIFSEGNRLCLDSFCSANGLSIDDFKSYAKEVWTEWQLTGQAHSDPVDARKHLLSQVRIKLNHDRKNKRGVSFDRTKAEAQRKARQEEWERTRAKAVTYNEYCRLKASSDSGMTEQTEFK